MKRVLLIFAFIISSHLSFAQDSYEAFNQEQQQKSIQIAKDALKIDVKFDSGMNYDGVYFWHVLSNDGKEFYFTSSNTFTEVKHEETTYSSLMEYVIETIGF